MYDNKCIIQKNIYQQYLNNEVEISVSTFPTPDIFQDLPHFDEVYEKNCVSKNIK